MKLRLLQTCCAAALVTISVICATAQPAFNKRFTFTQRNHPSPGYYLIGPVLTDSVGLVDGAGRLVMTRPSSTPYTLSVGNNHLLYYDQAVRGFVKRDRTMTPVDTLFMIGAGLIPDFHEAFLRENGNAVLLGYETRIIDMRQYVSNGDSLAEVIGAVIQEITPQGTAVFTWKSLDHIPVSDATDDIDLAQHSIDYIHVNSIDIDDDDNFLVSCRHTDEIIKVNRASGAVMWRLGGQKSVGNQFVWQNDIIEGFRGFSHQHSVSRTSDGKILLFDNGNLKPRRYSRVVAYDVDEVNMTVTRAWQWQPPNEIYASTMANVSQLPNGNYLVGYGSGSDVLIAHEFRPDGVIVMEMKAFGPRVSSYRVNQAVWIMTAANRDITTTGTYDFVSGDSATHMSLNVLRVNSPANWIIEKHHYVPHDASVAGRQPCDFIPMRWVVRASSTLAADGRIQLHLGSISGVEEPSQAIVYYRPVEGEGQLQAVQGTFDAQTMVFTIPQILEGEYCIGFLPCLNPTPLSPANGDVPVVIPTPFSWTAAVETDGYEVEIFRQGLTNPVKRFRTDRTDTTISDLSLKTTYRWRVRAYRSSGAGPWSGENLFTTMSAIPSALLPDVDSIPLATEQRPRFSWTRVVGASQYQVVVSTYPAGATVVDTTLADTAFYVNRDLELGGEYVWSVRSTGANSLSPWTHPKRFVVKPNVPRPIIPVNGTTGLYPNDVFCSWEAVDTIRSYHLEVRLEGEQDVWFEDTVNALTVQIPPVPFSSRVLWRVRTVGPYGASEFSATNVFEVVGPPALNSPMTRTPRGVTISRENVEFEWSAVPGATSYTLQYTPSPTFQSSATVTVTIQRDTSYLAPLLEPGTQYRWRVSAHSASIGSDWSTTAIFSTNPLPGQSLLPIAPADSSTNIPRSGTVTYTVGENFDTYRIRFSTTPEFDSLVADVRSNTSSALYLNLPPGRRIYWNVIGLSNGEEVDTGRTSTFTTTDVTSVIDGVDLSAISLIQAEGRILLTGLPSTPTSIMITDIAGRLVTQWFTNGEPELSRAIPVLATTVYIVNISAGPHAHSFVVPMRR